MNTREFQNFIVSLTASFTPVLGLDHSVDNYVSLDLSVLNKELDKVDMTSSQEVGRFIDRFIEDHHEAVAYGGYNEKRALYDRSSHFADKFAALEKRNIHLGIDLWAPAGTSVVAPLDGVIHSFKDNANYGDYGPCIILEHLEMGTQFYTLYGHLSRASLGNIHVGQKIIAHQPFAELGTSIENGDYAPHLHFQIIQDLQDNWGDYPGVCSTQDLNFYLSNCPDPKLLLKLK